MLGIEIAEVEVEEVASSPYSMLEEIWDF